MGGTRGMGELTANFFLTSRYADLHDCRFFYVDERKADGSSKGQAIDGPAHGEFIASLIENDEGVPWHATFVAGEGYVKFPR